MTVRMFQPRFAAKVISGKKHQTVRSMPKRMPTLGEQFEAREWIGKPYRSKQRVLKQSIIKALALVEISQGGAISVGGERLMNWVAEDFARQDGFKDYSEMLEWFHDTHCLPFEGIVIYF